MKKFLLTGAFSAMMLMASAQYDEGQILINGGFGFNSTSVNTSNEVVEDGELQEGLSMDIDGSSSAFSLNLRGYYFVSDNFAVGLGVFYGGTGANFTAQGNFGEDSLGADVSLDLLVFSPTVRYYIPIERELSFFLQGDIDFGFGIGDNNIELGGTTMENSLSVFGVGIQPGLSYTISRKFALEMTFGRLGFSQSTTTMALRQDEDNYTELSAGTSTFGLNLDSSALTFGFSMFLN